MSTFFCVYSKHPYIFFNQDHMTMTFIGFKVNDEYQCTDPKSGEVIEGCDVPENVFKGILTQGVNLKKDDTNSWNKCVFPISNCCDCLCLRYILAVTSYSGLLLLVTPHLSFLPLLMSHLPYFTAIPYLPSRSIVFLE